MHATKALAVVFLVIVGLRVTTNNYDGGAGRPLRAAITKKETR